MKVRPPRSVRAIARPCVALLLTLAAGDAAAQQAPADTAVLESHVFGRAFRDTTTGRLDSTAIRDRFDAPRESPPLLEKPPHGPLAPDRLQHASLAFAIGLGVWIASDDPAIGPGAAVGLGVIKELLDRPSSGFDRGDLIADLLGAGLAGLTAWRLAR